ncbi:DUF2326 domain-containing protein [Acinetobacter variabilis]|uniref:DUF2326 domain-containing protein n=1 Tax=Acinetobacter variabilis TaxID=70346 RepID=N9MRF7_9GAMM|nr:DUF2326 domain-containing protein [Acinetobacter variabilis]ENX11148.1 hypothetical protein F897_00558 [Acinetobacter variabilis]UBI29767.1 DUF2326 domain-containing protein [Acinetobacter variabilis]
MAAFKEERDRINEFLQVVERQQFQGQLIKESKVDQDRLAFEYVQEQPLDNFNRDFIELVNRLYPRLPAGIVLDNNSGDNQIRYNLTVQVQSDSSDGVNSARIVCFDWLLLTKGQRHQIDVLWHDNRLFADMDAIPRAQWFKFVNEQLKNSNKQYIVSLNQENYDSMFEYLTEVEKESFNNSVIIRLSGDDPKNKLLGIQFGKTVSLH